MKFSKVSRKNNYFPAHIIPGLSIPTLAGMENKTPEQSKTVIGKKLLTEKEACHYTGLSLAFLRLRRSQGAPAGITPGPDFVKLGRAVRYDLEDLNAWIENNKSRPEGA